MTRGCAFRACLAGEAALERMSPPALGCNYRVESVPFTEEFKYRLGLADRPGTEEKEATDERIEKAFRNLQESIAAAWKLPMPETPAKFASTLNRWLRDELADQPRVPRVLILDELDPTDVHLALEFCDLAVLLDAQRQATGDFSIIVGTRYSAALLGMLGPELKSASNALVERWHHISMLDLTDGETSDLAAILAPDAAAKLKAAMKKDSEYLLHHPFATHLCAWWRSQLAAENRDTAFASLASLVELASAHADTGQPAQPTAIARLPQHLLSILALFDWKSADLDQVPMEMLTNILKQKSTAKTTVIENFLRSAGLTVKTLDNEPQWKWKKLLRLPWLTA